MKAQTWWVAAASLLLSVSAYATSPNDVPPPGASVSGVFRTRYAHLKNAFRAKQSGDDRGLSLRANARLAWRWRSLFAATELMDARLYLTDGDTPLNGGLINPVALLQAHGGVVFDDPFGLGGSACARFGRMTMDVGSRRLIARNRFRNTINAFTGLDVGWTEADRRFRVFMTLPVRRRPTAPDALAAHRIEYDTEGFDTLFTGFLYGAPLGGEGVRIMAEVYVFGLYERDTPASRTRNRRLVTPGFRVVRASKKQVVDFELEAAFQAGRSRASTSDLDTDDLDHFAVFGHASVGYSPGWLARPRLLVQYDYASGDSDPDDTTNGRFDRLFGAQRFEYGPTGLYGALGRSNSQAVGVRIQVRLGDRLQACVGYRAAWLAARKDAWPSAEVRDPSGESGTFLGHQLEGRLRWKVLPPHVSAEVGFAHLWRGEFARTAPNRSMNGNPTYLYTQLTFFAP